MRILKWIVGILVFLVIAFFITTKILSKPLPEGQTGAAADALAQKVLTAINYPAWDTTGVIQWTFPGEHHYLWDKNRNLVEVKWDDYRVLVVLDETTGRAWKGAEEITGAAGDQLVKKAWEYFCNDSFWLNAPAKVFDPGTTRRLVRQENGSEALLITYESGGVTPGDSYLWLLEDNGLPKSCQMWVSIIPVGGVEFSWDNWTTLATGAKVATFHQSKVLNIEITNLKAAANLSKIGLDKDPFLPII